MGQVDPPPQKRGKQSPRAGQPSGRLQVLSRPDSPPRIARLFHRWGERPVALASEALGEALDLMSSNFAPLLLAGAGFVSAHLPEPTRERYPDESEFAAVTALAAQVAESVRSCLPPDRPLIVIGVDVYAACSRSPGKRQLGQFAVVLEPDGSPSRLLPKRFPMPSEEAYLRVPGNSSDPIITTPAGMAAVLVCHDVNVYSPRGEDTTVYEARAGWRSSLRDRIRSLTPALGLHLAHYVETAASFRQSYNVWTSEVGVPLIGVSGLPSDLSMADATALVASLLAGADEWPVLDLLELPTE